MVVRWVAGVAAVNAVELHHLALLVLKAGRAAEAPVIKSGKQGRK
jgi:hypothetical protein